MSSLPQFTNSPEQPMVPAPIRTRLSRQSTEQPTLSLCEWEGRHVIQYRAIAGAINQQIRLLEHPKPPEGAHEFQYFPPGVHLRGLRRDLALNELEQAYVFENRPATAAFVERNRLRELLLEAQEPLNAAFGEGAVKKLTLVEDDEGFTALFCLILVPGDMVAARLALKSFDEQWWLARSCQAGGKLNFDFELI